MKTYNFVQVPAVGFTLAESTWTFGYKELFRKDYKIEAYISGDNQLKNLERLVDTESKKGTIKTLAYGVGTAGTAASASSAILSIAGLVCSGGACPIWLGSILAAAAPVAWIPVVATGGFIVGKRLGGRRGLRYMNKSFSKAKIKTLNYEPMEKIIRKHNLDSKIFDYYIMRIEGTRMEKLKRIFSEPPEMKKLKQELKEGFFELKESSKELYEKSEGKEKELYQVINKTYDYIHKGFKGKILKTKGYVTFGV